MCGRFTLHDDPGQIVERFRLRVGSAFLPRYNVAPTQSVPAVRQGAGGRELVLLRWGLIPSWAKDPKIGYSLINARAETVADKPAFRSAFRRRRCLIPASGFLEWAKLGKVKQPYHFRRKDHAPLALAGLWECWESPEGEVIESCTIITTAANELVAPMHDRMPVILDPADFDRWLDLAYQQVDGLTPLLVPYPAEVMEAVAVSPLVNSPKNDGPECLMPVA
jgi:putative SOS response-associated peptidase YedK